ncbi:MAG: DUF1572 family protein [Spirosomataceae bacterium]
MPILSTLQALYQRDLSRLHKEIESYQNEANIWKVDKQIPNSAGNLALHLVGNLNTYIGAVLGNSGYIRDRPFEFSAKDVPRHQLLKQIQDTRAVVEQVLGALNEQTLENEFPMLVFEQPTSTEYMLVHLATHLGYHLGQINYHRRLLDI